MAACYGIKDLSDEVLLKIISCFSQKELCRYVAPVCVAWLNFSRDWSLWEEIAGDEYWHLSDDQFIAIVTSSWCSHLKFVDFQARSDLTEDNFEAVFKHCPKLESISFELCSQVDDTVLEILSKHCNRLKFVNLTGCRDVSTKSMIHFLGKPMQGFNISSWHYKNFTDEGLVFLANNFKDLSMINLCDAVKITPASINVLTRLHSDHLIEVVLDGECLTDVAVRMLSRCTMMRIFMILNCHELTDKSLKRIKNFKHLEQLKLKSGYQFSETAIIKMLQRFKHLVGAGLRHLDLGDCLSFSDQCLYEISESCRNLQVLSISRCFDVTDAGIDFIFDTCHKIRELYLKYLPRLNGATLRRVPVEMPKLAILDLTSCENCLSDNLLIELKKEMKTLKILNCLGHFV